jgi:hypothetical protein
MAQEIGVLPPLPVPPPEAPPAHTVWAASKHTARKTIPPIPFLLLVMIILLKKY